MHANNSSSFKVAVVIPCYKVREHIIDVINSIGPEIHHIYAVDDGCPEKTGLYIEEHCNDKRVTVLYNDHNKGVGGATKPGYLKALEDSMDIVVKLDGDGQMDARLIPGLIKPILDGNADYVKGNRFFSYEHLGNMPRNRLFGNAVLTFFSKASSGYWDIYDPNNGFTAIHRNALSMLPLDKIHDRYFFESDMLFRLGTIRAVVYDIPMKAVYGQEVSNLKIRDVFLLFLSGHIKNSWKRLIYGYYVRDFNIASLELLTGIMLLGFGIIYGGINWLQSISSGQTAPGGVVMLSGLTVIISVQLFLSAFNYDVQNIPRKPLQHLGYDISD